MEETRNWLEMPHEIMGGMILQRIGAIEILKSAQKVCTTWRRICKNPAMWKVIFVNGDMGFDIQKLMNQLLGVNLSSDARDRDSDVVKLIKQAVHRSCGELIDITLDSCGTDHLLDYISRSSSKLNRLCLSVCSDITGCGLSNALKNIPHLETLELSFISISEKDIEVIGCNCPQLKSFKMETWVIDFDGFANSIANSMPALRHLHLDGHLKVKDDGIRAILNGSRAILNGCPHLQSLVLCGCFNIHLDENLEKLCRERIKDFKCKRNSVLECCEEIYMDFSNFDEFNVLYDGGGIDLPVADDAAAAAADG